MKRTIFVVAMLLSGLILTSDVGGQRRKTQKQTKEPARSYNAVLLLVRPDDSWTVEDAKKLKKQLRAMNFTVRSLNSSDVKEDELQCDVIVTIDADCDWSPGKTVDSKLRVTYGVNAPRLNKRDRWEESAVVGDFNMADARRFNRALENAISWIRENVVSK